MEDARVGSMDIPSEEKHLGKRRLTCPRMNIFIPLVGCTRIPFDAVLSRSSVVGWDVCSLDGF